ncbi:hypothetical protein Tco_0978785 [Tanacetum coccineum]|uniref:Uncharacterized protein n=1 Tax=Tanacetum coccineum TaxID=301880 RepID=A0ABQ5EPD5_9ASTR
MTSLADKSLLSGGDNKPPMLEKHLYDSWKSRMELYMMNRPHGRMIFQKENLASQREFILGHGLLYDHAKACDYFASQPVLPISISYCTHSFLNRLMALSIADQIALDDALVAPADRLKIGKCNLRLSSDVTSKEATLQVVYDVLKITPFYKAFQVTVDSSKIYIAGILGVCFMLHSIFYVRFKINNKKHIIGLEQFRDILQICLKVGNKKFVDLPLENEILIFLASLGHSGDIRSVLKLMSTKLLNPGYHLLL